MAVQDLAHHHQSMVVVHDGHFLPPLCSQVLHQHGPQKLRYQYQTTPTTPSSLVTRRETTLAQA